MFAIKKFVVYLKCLTVLRGKIKRKYEINGNENEKRMFFKPEGIITLRGLVFTYKTFISVQIGKA